MRIADFHSAQESAISGRSLKRPIALLTATAKYFAHHHNVRIILFACAVVTCRFHARTVPMESRNICFGRTSAVEVLPARLGRLWPRLLMFAV
jgi:hypothetical protein